MTGTSLTAEANSLGIRPRPIDWAEFALRAVVSLIVLALFWVVNSHVIGLVTEFAADDIKEIAAKTITPSDRVITEKVILALIGGALAQVITVLLGITRYIFPVPKE